jgi:16S rRNA (uracil1498-N3)-methyltransferase
MELFYSENIEGGICRLDHDESGHCIKVLRHRCGDEISVIDGHGTLYRCRITNDSHKGVEAMVLDETSDWGSHPYHLHLAVCPTKNNDRYEWFAEKACEMGFDELSPVIGEHSERKILKTQRVEKILISAAKQSLKASVPVVNEPISVKEFIQQNGAGAASSQSISLCSCSASCSTGYADHLTDSIVDSEQPLRLIAYCFEDENIPRRSIKDVLNSYEGREIIVMIGPEGDFSKEEADAALAAGFIPVHLGASRLRTETAALTAASAVYFRFL